MTEVIVSSPNPVALIGGAPLPKADLKAVLALTDVCVAADGGAVSMLEFGVMPQAVIGDFDSLSPDARRQIPPEILHHVAEQDSTDFDKAMRAISAPVVVAAGVTGARFDHSLAALHGLAVRPHQPCILLGETEITCLLPPELTVPTEEGDVVSLMPLAPVTGQSKGLVWAIDGLAFDPLTFIGTSNRATGPCELILHKPAMLGLFPRRLLPALTQALAQLPLSARWPAPER